MPSALRIKNIVDAALAGIGGTVGTIFYVCSTQTGAADSAGRGLTPETALATWDYAIGRCTASKGDVIVLMPGHVETVTAAAGVALDVAGVTTIGLGSGRIRPTVNYTTAITASVDVTAANCLVKNVVFTPIGFDAITAAMNVTAADFWMDGCEWQISTGTNAPVLGILTAATATRLKVTNTKFLGPATSTSTVTACIKHEVGIDFEIDNCDFHGKMTQAILNATTLHGGKIHNNRFQIYTGTKGIALAAATTAFITNNRFNVPSGTAPIIAAAGFVAGNVYSAAAGVTAGTASTI